MHDTEQNEREYPYFLFHQDGGGLTGTSGEGLGTSSSPSGGGNDSGGTGGAVSPPTCPDSSLQPSHQLCTDYGSGGGDNYSGPYGLVCLTVYDPCPPSTSAPASPTNLNGSCTGTSAQVSWTGSSSDTSYDLRVDDTVDGWNAAGPCNVESSNDICIDNYTSTSKSFTGTPGHTYNFWIHGVNSVGVSTPTTGASFSCAPTSAVPQPPASISATCSASGTTANISWPASSGATQYQVSIMPTSGNIGPSCPSGWSFYTDPNNGHTLCYQQLSGTTTTFPALANGTQYATWVSPYNAASGWNWNSPPVTNLTCYSSKPTAPTPLTTSCTAGSQVTLSWPTISGATTYSPGLFLPLGSACPSGWTADTSGGYATCQTSTTGTTTTITGTVPQGVSGTGVIYAGNAAGYSSGTTQNFNCSPPPTATLSASPVKVVSGDTTNLTWTSTNATSCVAAGGFSTGNRANSLSAPATSIALTTDPSYFQITCTGPGGSVIAKTQVQVTSPTVTISASPTRVLSDNKTIVTWTATDVDSCDITRNDISWKTGLTGAALNSSSPDTVTSQTVYKITCTDASAKAHADSVVVNTESGGFEEF